MMGFIGESSSIGMIFEGFPVYVVVVQLVDGERLTMSNGCTITLFIDEEAS